MTKCLDHYVEQAFNTITKPTAGLNYESVIILNILTTLST